VKGLTDTKYCKRCNRTLPLERFHKDKKLKDGHAFYCKECCSEYGKQYRKTANSAYSSSKGTCTYRDRKPFNISKEDYLKWYKSQPRVCGYCGLPESEIKNIDDKFLKPTKRLTVDCKNNALGYINGNLVLSCRRCNSLKLDFFTYEEMCYIGQNMVKPRWENQLGYKLS